VSRWHLAQINVGTLVGPEGDPRVQPFFDQLDAVNAVAEATPGFVWRLKGEGNNATDINPTPDPRFVLNLSVWEDVEALMAFAYRSDHGGVLAQRGAWFQPHGANHMALWWVPTGARPGMEAGLARLWLLDRYGPSLHAFTFRTRFGPPA
jgi:hypothetical protein